MMGLGPQHDPQFKAILDDLVTRAMQGLEPPTNDELDKLYEAAKSHHSNVSEELIKGEATAILKEDWNDDPDLGEFLRTAKDASNQALMKARKAMAIALALDTYTEMTTGGRADVFENIVYDNEGDAENARVTLLNAVEILERMTAVFSVHIVYLLLETVMKAEDKKSTVKRLSEEFKR